MTLALVLPRMNKLQQYCPEVRASMTQEKRLVLVLMLNLGMIVGLLAVGISSHSLGVLAAGGDYLADAAAIGISLLAIHVGRRPNGMRRATSYAALTNVIFLLVVTAFVVVEALHRLSTHTSKIEAIPVVVVSVIAAVVMVVSALILGGDADENDLNIKSVMLDTIADAISAVSVAITGGIILVTKGYYWLDPLMALVVASIIGYHALKLLHDVLIELRPK